MWNFRSRLIGQALAVLEGKPADIAELDELIVLGVVEAMPDDEPMYAKDLREAALNVGGKTAEPSHGDVVAWPRLMATLVVVAYVLIAELEVAAGEVWPAEVRELLTRAVQVHVGQSLDGLERVNAAAEGA